MIRVQLKITMDINLPLNYAQDATLAMIKEGVRTTVKEKAQALFADQTDFTPVPPFELVLLSLEDTL